MAAPAEMPATVWRGCRTGAGVGERAGAAEPTTWPSDSSTKNASTRIWKIISRC